VKDQAARKATVLEQLRELKQDVDSGRTDRGSLCQEVTYPIELHTYFYSWKHFSGNAFYPVPQSKRVVIGDPSRKYIDALYLGAFWTKEYGRLRYNLLEHIIQCLEEELCQNSNQGTSS
jgi:hypothetical protein